MTNIRETPRGFLQNLNLSLKTKNKKQNRHLTNSPLSLLKYTCFLYMGSFYWRSWISMMFFSYNQVNQISGWQTDLHFLLLTSNITFLLIKFRGYPTVKPTIDDYIRYFEYGRSFVTQGKTYFVT